MPVPGDLVSTLVHLNIAVAEQSFVDRLISDSSENRMGPMR